MADIILKRRYSDSCVRTAYDVTDNARVPPLPDISDRYGDMKDLDMWEANITCQEKLNSYRTVDSENNEVALAPESGATTDEIEDDWFVKLTNENEAARLKSILFDFTNGGDHDSIPLLRGKELDLREKTMKTLRVGLKKIWKRGSATITEADPTYKVSYLGNVLTGWAKGEGCVEKPLSTLWKNYSNSTKPDVHMKVTVTQSGLKAVTKEHGLTEYWSNRITYCAAPASLPRIFCWVYRHEGRKLKQELRCHAVLCSKESVARSMATTLRMRLAQALSEFKRDKLLRQNARLSLANSVYDNPSLPRRKILLSTGSHNYKPPLERSKSAPKLMAIEESIEEDDGTPKSKRRLYSVDETATMADILEEEEEGKLEEIRATKIPNLAFVKKLCSSIENLVDTTSKKFLNERKYSREFCTVRTEECIKNPPILVCKTDIELEGEEYRKRSKPRKSVTFEDEKEPEEVEFKKCTEYKKRTINEECEEEPSTNGANNLLLPVEVQQVELSVSPTDTAQVNLTVLPNEPQVETKENLVISKLFRDSDSSDEGSNSLQSISSCSSDATVSSTEKEFFSDVQGKIKFFENDNKSIDRIANRYLDDVFVGEETPTVILHPTGGLARSTGQNPNKKFLRSSTFPLSNSEKFREEIDSLSEDEGKDADGEDDVVSDESGYVELTESIMKRMSLDSKEKDTPFHQLIKSTVLRPQTIESSCLQV